VGIRVFDRRERELPRVGLIHMTDNESGREFLADTSSREVRETYKYRWKIFERKLNETFIKSGVDMTEIQTGSDYIKPLIGLFKKRESRF
jgi:hypothetical protein